MMNSSRVTALGIGLFGIFSFCLALVWEFWGGAVPCTMCYIERWGFLSTGILGICAFLTRKELILQRFFAVIGFVYLGISTVLFRHLGTQYQWFQVPGICRASRPLTEADLSAQLLNPTPQVTCDHIEFTLLGQPPTFYLLGCTLALTALCFWMFIRGHSQNKKSSLTQRAYFM